MNKFVKKILALVLAVMMVLGTVSALADNLPAAGGPQTTTNSPQTTTLSIDKALVVKNDVGNIEVNYPSVTYTFSVAPKSISDTDNNAYVQDAAGNKVAVQTGYADAIGFDTLGNATKELTFTSGTVRLNSNGEEALTKALSIVFNAPAHKAPGIYRYLLTDTTPDTNLTSKYIVRKDTVAKEYNLDVYIGFADDNNDNALDDKNNDGKIDENDLVIGGYVLTEDDGTSGETPVTPATQKESGLDDLPELEPRGNEPDPNNPQTGDDPDNNPGDQDDKKIKNAQQLSADQLKNNDVYYTYNVELTKVVAGTAGDTVHEFPFTLTIVNTIGSEALDYVVSETDADSTDLSNKLATVNLSNGDVAKIQGLAPNATVKYKEKNDTPSRYTVGVTAGSTKLDITGGTEAVAADKTRYADADVEIEMGAALNVASGYALNQEATANSDTSNVTFTNKLDSISPTGVVLRFAPYFAMLGAGLFFLVLFTRRRKEEEEA